MESNSKLIKEYRKSKSIKLRNKIVVQNYNLALYLARKQSHNCFVELEDLQQVAVFGLMKAIEKFNTETNNKFSTFASTWIKGEMLHYIRDKSLLIKLPRDISELNSKINSTRKALQKKTGKHPTDKEIASKLGMPIGAFKSYLEHKPLMFATLASEDDLDQTAIKEESYKVDAKLDIEMAIAKLHPKTASVIHKLYLEDVPSMTANKELGLAHTTFNYHHKNGLKMLQKELSNYRGTI